MNSVHFLSKDGKSASYEGGDGWKSCLFPTRVGISDFDVVTYEVLFPICTLTWRVSNYVFRQGKGINRRNKKADLELLLALCSTDDINQYC